MGQRELREQRELIESAIESADDAKLRYVLEGTLKDAHSFCRATLRQFSRRIEQKRESPRDYGFEYVDRHILIAVAHDTVSQVSVVERLLQRMGVPRDLPPNNELRVELREIRNLLAVHRDEHILYWRLTGENTPHIKTVYKRLGLPEPTDSIGKEIVAYFPEPGKTEQEIEAGYARVGTVGDLLSLREVYFAFKELEGDLDELAERYCT